MSWFSITYWALRCDGRTPYGQCLALLAGPDGERAVAWNDEGDRVCQPLLFTTPPPLGLLRSEPRRGWLVVRDRTLCPEHVAAEEYLAAAGLDGLPLDETDEN